MLLLLLVIGERSLCWLLFHDYWSSSVPFDEDDRDDSVWFLDHDYLENMYGMFKKVNGEDFIKTTTYCMLSDHMIL